MVKPHAPPQDDLRAELGELLRSSRVRPSKHAAVDVVLVELAAQPGLRCRAHGRPDDRPAFITHQRHGDGPTLELLRDTERACRANLLPDHQLSSPGVSGARGLPASSDPRK